MAGRGAVLNVDRILETIDRGLATAPSLDAAYDQWDDPSMCWRCVANPPAADSASGVCTDCRTALLSEDLVAPVDEVCEACRGVALASNLQVDWSRWDLAWHVTVRDVVETPMPLADVYRQMVIATLEDPGADHYSFTSYWRLCDDEHAAVYLHAGGYVMTDEPWFAFADRAAALLAEQTWAVDRVDWPVT